MAKTVVDLGQLFLLLMALDERGVDFMATDGTRVYLGPKDKLSMRLRGEVRRVRKQLADTLPLLPPFIEVLPEHVECFS